MGDAGFEIWKKRISDVNHEFILQFIVQIKENFLIRYEILDHNCENKQYCICVLPKYVLNYRDLGHDEEDIDRDMYIYHFGKRCSILPGRYFFSIN